MAIAKMSPGIVRFYFESKAAMLVASLQFLAAEFEERVLAPVARIRSSPVAALQLLVELYLNPEIASPRKVSVWYAFWGEASSRQEYYDICGQKDESFAILVRELVASLIDATSRRQLDPDGVALGLIGALEMMWQEFAFKNEEDIDRSQARERCLGYLRSVFPGQFPRAAPAPAPAAAGGDGGRDLQEEASAASARYGDRRLLLRERERLFAESWCFLGHESEIPRSGDFLTVDTAVERALVVRDDAGAVRVYRNSCPAAPHALVTARRGGLAGGIECRAHGLHFSLTGLPGAGSRDEGPPRLDVRVLSGWIFARSPGMERDDGWVLPFETEPPPGLMALSHPREAVVGADWKIVVERWLESPPRGAAAAVGEQSLLWSLDVDEDSRWSARRYLSLLGAPTPQPLACPGGWRRCFVPPNQLFETRPDGCSVIQAVPLSAGRCVVRRSDYSILSPDDAARAFLFLAARLGPSARRSTGQLAESVQVGMTEFAYAAAPGGPPSPALAWFRAWLSARMGAPALDPAANRP